MQRVVAVNGVVVHDVPFACAPGLLLVCEYQVLYLVPLTVEGDIMSFGSFAAGTGIFVGAGLYKVGRRVGTILVEASEDASARIADPVNGWDAAISKVDVDELAYQQKCVAKRAARAAAVAAMAAAPAAPAVQAPASVIIV